MLNNIPATIQPLLDATRAQTQSLLKLMQLGQTVPAKVINMTSPDIAKLLMSGKEITAQTNVQLKPGQQLLLQVIKTGAKPQLQIQQPTTQVSDQFVLIKNALPKQLLPQEVQQSLKSILSSPLKTEANAAKLFSQIIENKAIPAQKIDSPAIKQALNTSGLLLEAQLAKGIIPSVDNKADMLRLLSLWMPAIKETIAVKQRAAPNDPSNVNNAENKLPAASLLERLTRLLEGSITRVQTHQASSLPNEEGGRQIWQFEIPIKVSDAVEHPLVQIERDDSKQDGEGNSGWSVNLSFNFETLGPVQSRIGLEGEAISVTFWSEIPSTRHLIQEKLPLLEAALRHVGLKIGNMASAPGKPQEDFMTLNVDHALLDERA